MYVNFIIAPGQYDIFSLSLQPYAVQNIANENGLVKLSLSFCIRDSSQAGRLEMEIDRLQFTAVPYSDLLLCLIGDKPYRS